MKILGILGTLFGYIGTRLHPLTDPEAWSIRDLLQAFIVNNGVRVTDNPERAR